MTSALKTQTLGRTGLEVSILGFGAMELRGSTRPVTAGRAEEILGSVLDAGINYIDTSIDYGASEELIGRYLSGRRSEFVLASKCGCPVGDLSPGPPGPHDYSHTNLVAGVEQSLRRLRTDHLDLLQIHLSPSKEELDREGALETLVELRAAGKTRYIGISSTLPNLPDHVALDVFDVFQVPYSALDRDHEEAIYDIEAAGAGVVVRGGVARGLPDNGRRNADAWDRFARAELAAVAPEIPPMELLLRFVLGHPGVDTVIVGTQDPGHLAENLRFASRGPLPPELQEEIRRRLDAIDGSPS